VRQSDCKQPKTRTDLHQSILFSFSLDSFTLILNLFVFLSVVEGKILQSSRNTSLQPLYLNQSSFNFPLQRCNHDSSSRTSDIQGSARTFRIIAIQFVTVKPFDGVRVQVENWKLTQTSVICTTVVQSQTLSGDVVASSSTDNVDCDCNVILSGKR
jgi:hypothetical protein